jgi:hypothetical protein
LKNIENQPFAKRRNALQIKEKQKTKKLNNLKNSAAAFL